MAEDPIVGFKNFERIPFALMMLDCWLGNGDRKLRTEDILADVFGHPSYSALVNVSASWAAGAKPYGPTVRGHLAWKLSSVTGRKEADCAAFLDLLNAEGAAVDRKAVLKGLARHFAGYPLGGSITSFFDDFGFLLNDADFALRLRAAGKRDLGYNNALKSGQVDVLDCFHMIDRDRKPPETFHPGPALALYYAAPTSSTVMCRNVFKPSDGFPALIRFGDDFDNMLTLLEAARGYGDPRLDHWAFGDIIREPVFPVPENGRQLEAAVTSHWMLRNITDEFFGIAHPNYVLPKEGPCKSWVRMERELRRPECQLEFMEGARDRIRDFVEGYSDGEDEVYVSFSEWDVLALADECRVVSRCDDAALARYLAADNGLMWVDNETGDAASIRAAVGNFSAGGQKKMRRPAREKGVESWMRMPELQEASRQMMDIVRGRK